MKSAIYIDNGTVQLVLTPENEFEKKAVMLFEQKKAEAEIFHASFGECHGGYTRLYPSSDVYSLILRAKVEVTP